MVPVILLIGSSTAGKTSICNSPAFNAFAKSGVDLAFQNPIMLSKSIYAILKHMKLKFKDSETIRLINASGKTIKKITEEIKKEIVTDLDEDQWSPTRVALHNDLAKSKDLQVRFHLAMDNLVLQDAVKKSLSGVPVILDMVPNEMYDIVSLFKKVMAQYKCSGDVIVVHCPLQTLSKRIESRNSQAIASGNEEEVRDGFFPFEQYANLFGTNGNGPIVDFISPDSVQSIFSPKPPLDRKFDVKQIAEYLTSLGFSEVDILQGSNHLPMKLKLTGYDQVIDTAQKNSKLLAGELHHFATRGLRASIVSMLPLEASLANKTNRLLAYEKFCSSSNYVTSSSKPGYGPGAMVPYRAKSTV